eukprot:TRINITY_DN57398_c0_g1_i1.p1 TRINITY_DN57398_c0_g1~~TRINITY_DN57398_c0_g1_i1.p1  ORF type:complete len:396 (-),score=89.21 TRINITY_DN57398_c0_g1_i1:158-1345(-)
MALPSFLIAPRRATAAVRMVAMALVSLALSASEGVGTMQLAPVPDDVGVTEETAHVPGRSGDVMMDLLDWATKHSEPERLAEVLKKYNESNLTLKDVYGQDFLDALFVDEANVMQLAIEQIHDFKNTSVTDEDLEDSVTRLQEMVEQVDNAGNLHKMGGLEVLLELAEYEERSDDLRTLALWTLGVAVQNNAPVQADFVVVDGLRRLTALLPRCDGKQDTAGSTVTAFCVKLVFALSGLVRNNAQLQASADELGLFDWLLDVGVPSSKGTVAHKSIGLLETVLGQSPNLPFMDGLLSRQDAVGASLVAHIRGVGNGSGSTDGAEKALQLVNKLLELRPFLFGPSFRSELEAASTAALHRCEDVHGSGSEFCVELDAVSGQVKALLAARDVSDEEL